MTRYLENGALDSGFGISGSIKSPCDLCDNVKIKAYSLDRYVLGLSLLDDGGLILGHSRIEAVPGHATRTCYIDQYPANGRNPIRLKESADICFQGIRELDGNLITSGPCVSCTTRLKPDGILDTSFGLSGTISSTLGLNLQPRQQDGKVLSVNLCCPYPDEIVVVRMDSMGRPDPDFGTAGYARYPFLFNAVPPSYKNASQASDISLDFNGHIVIGGNYLADVPYVRRFPVILRLRGSPVPIRATYLPLVGR